MMMSIMKTSATVCLCQPLYVPMLSCPPKPEQRVSLETDRETTETIGAEGGTVEATASDGTVYTLAVPPNAFPAPVEMTMTPVSGNRNGVDLLGTYEGMIGYVDATGSNDYEDYTVVLTQNQNAISGTYEGVSQVGNTRISGIITGTLSTTGDLPVGVVHLENLELTQQIPCGATMRSTHTLDVYVGSTLGIDIRDPLDPSDSVYFDTISGCPACFGDPAHRWCGASVWMILEIPLAVTFGTEGRPSAFGNEGHLYPL